MNAHVAQVRAFNAAVARRPTIDPHDAACAAQLVANARANLREAYRLLRGPMPHLAEKCERAGQAINAVAGQLPQNETPKQ